MTKYMITYMLENPYYEVEADSIDQAEELAFKEYVKDGYDVSAIMDMEYDTEEEAI